MKNKNLILLIAATIMGLTAGIFYCWSVSVMVGLAPLPNDQYLEAFQSLNRKIENPLFFLCFFGSAILLPISTFMHSGKPRQRRFTYLLIASIVYIVGVIGITSFANMPLNMALDKFNVGSATAAQIAEQRAVFEGPWNQLNNLRSFACIVSLVLTILACLTPHETGNTKKLN